MNIQFTQQEEQYIIENYLTIPIKRMAKMMGRSNFGVRNAMKRMKIAVPDELIADRKRIGLLKKGNIPPNKGKRIEEFMSEETIIKFKSTQFKNGHKPHNTSEADGAITIRNMKMKNNSVKSYKYIRISMGNWHPLHQIIWQQANGVTPKGHCLRFKDGNSLNCELANLELISTNENSRRNSKKFYALPKELRDIIILTNKLKKVINQQSKNEK